MQGEDLIPNKAKHRWFARSPEVRHAENNLISKVASTKKLKQLVYKDISLINQANNIKKQET